MELTERWVQEVLDDRLQDVEVVDLEQSGGGRRRTVRVFIDHPDGVDHELCADVSEAVSVALDDAGYAPGPYTLEVSSPGVERPLKKKAHFEAQLGEKVYVKTYAPIAGQKVWRGFLRAVGDEDIVLEVDDEEISIPLRGVAKAHLVFEFD